MTLTVAARPVDRVLPHWTGLGNRVGGASGREPGWLLDRLSDREREVLALMAEGRSNLGICRRLFLSPKTVESHVRSILLRLDIAPEPEDNRRVMAVLAHLQAPDGVVLTC